MLIMAIHIDLIACCHFFLMTYGLNVQFRKKSYHLKVKSFDFLLLATFYKIIFEVVKFHSGLHLS